MSRYWFKPKRYGYGATPATWEGWAFTGLIVAVIARLAAGCCSAPACARAGRWLLVWWAIVAVVRRALGGGDESQDRRRLAVAVGTRLTAPA